MYLRQADLTADAPVCQDLRYQVLPAKLSALNQDIPNERAALWSVS
jgi:hypothetical protein